MSGDRRFGLRNVLVAVQVGLSLALVVGGLLFVRTLTTLAASDLGFNPEGVVSISVNARQNDEGRDSRLQLFGRLREAAAAVPGVSSAAVSVLTPMNSMRWNTQVEPTPATAALTESSARPGSTSFRPGGSARSECGSSPGVTSTPAIPPAPSACS